MTRSDNDSCRDVKPQEKAKIKYGEPEMKLYHTSSVVIRDPDIYRGRKNADFGQGFYLTPDLDFARRWAFADAVINVYELDESGLLLQRLERDGQWYRYIFQNRRSCDECNADVVIGPIANDTIFDTLGIITSGFLDPSEALQLLMIGPEYVQVAVKTEKAVSQLRWTGSERIKRFDEKQLKEEQREYQRQFAEAMSRM